VKAHHLNCGTMRMPTVPTLVSHVLLLETDAGLVLVDTGFGLEDIAGLARRLGWFRHVIRPVFSAEETPARQAGRLGFTQDDVRHIIITHFDMDHIGALADFPRAAVHATAAEARGATRPGSWLERQRYRFPSWRTVQRSSNIARTERCGAGSRPPGNRRTSIEDGPVQVAGMQGAFVSRRMLPGPGPGR
jgi:glyoxylase-like metal-dependent hydrolase (beta-lactamase superfamily II)